MGRPSCFESNKLLSRCLAPGLQLPEPDSRSMRARRASQPASPANRSHLVVGRRLQQAPIQVEPKAGGKAHGAQHAKRICKAGQGPASRVCCMRGPTHRPPAGALHAMGRRHVGAAAALPHTMAAPAPKRLSAPLRRVQVMGARTVHECLLGRHGCADDAGPQVSQAPAQWAEQGGAQLR